MQTIRPKSFIRLHGPKSIFDFLKSDHGSQRIARFIRKSHLPMTKKVGGPLNLYLGSGVKIQEPSPEITSLSSVTQTPSSVLIEAIWFLFLLANVET